MKKFLQTFNRTDSEDPMKVFRYHVEIQQFARFGFTSVTGVSADVDVVEFREGGSNTTPLKSPGITKFPDVTLVRGQIFAAAFGSNDVLNWFRQVFDVSAKWQASSRNFRRSVDIVQFDKEAVERYRWRLKQAWPRSIRPLSDLDALKSDNSLEQMVIVHEGFQLVSST